MALKLSFKIIHILIRIYIYFTVIFTVTVSPMSQKVHQPQPAHQQDGQEDHDCDVRSVWEIFLPQESAEEAWKRFAFILKLNCTLL